MRILNLSNTAGKSSGGIGDVVHALVRHQNECHADSSLWFPGGSNLESEVQNLTMVSCNKIKAFQTIGPANLGISPKLFNNIKYVENNFDILHQHGAFLPISLFSKFLSKNIKVVISPHGLFEPERLRTQFLKKKIVRYLFEDSNFKNSSCLVACSTQEAINLKALNFKLPIAILPNGINENFMSFKSTPTDRKLFRQKKNIPANKKVMLFLSRIHPLKGLKLLLNALSDLKEKIIKNNWVLVIAGIDENNHEMELVRLVNKLGINDLVYFIGPVYGKEKLLSYDISSTFILPSLNENFGIVVIEALARAIPVITTKNTPWKDLDEYSCGWWIDRNKDSFISTLEAIAELDDKILHVMGSNGKNLVKNRYLWPSIAKQSISLYNWVLNDFNDDYNHGFQLFCK